MLNRRKALGLGVAACLLPARVLAATDVVMAVDGVALGGIDPLSYWLDGEPRLGDPTHRILWRDAMWHFADSDRLAAFERNPRGLSPAYGGYCAYALSQGIVVASDPEVFSMVENRLFLNQTHLIRQAWLSDVPGHVASADANWPQILG
ncbi:YHS domain protein [Salipiger sp. IMCC34102]|uniref:YHS domain-containing (seleno)protein n=1 Tax=Salipiger sp. IMCC34102 TaxID=2510647 RepID=UPI00101DB3F6|nr:YHS domain-containing (seleno)protein [Salipiger sp. IMCC34102]RYH03562.1 YHS domain protein [Salipiger sp. IMCC34102]